MCGIIIEVIALGNEKMAETLALLALPIAVIGIVFSCILHYRCWKALPQRFQATTPGKAVGYLFIPFYCFYWAFISWPKLADGITGWQKSKGIMRQDDIRGLGFTYAIIFVCHATIGLIPGLGLLVGIADMVIFFLFYKKIVAAINSLQRS